MGDSFLSQRLSAMPLSATFAMSARAAALEKEGRSIIHCELGEPDFPSPSSAKQAARLAIEQDFTHYTPVGGILELKERIADRFKDDLGLSFSPAQIMVSTGAKQCLYNAFMALLDPGEEIIIPAPYWVSYPDMARLAQAIPVILPTTMEQSFKICPEQLQAAITAKTKVFLLNSPSNPSGMIYDAAALSALAALLMQHPHVWIICDDIYRSLQWDAPRLPHLLQIEPALAHRTVLINGCSKTFAMTGWRIGYCAAPPALIQAMTVLQGQVTSNPCSIAQKAALGALSEAQPSLHLEQMLLALKERHDWLYTAILGIEGLSCLASAGTFYLLIDVRAVLVSKNIPNDEAFCLQLLEEQGLALVPGSASGLPGFVRLSFCVDLSVLKIAVERLKSFVSH